MAIILHHPATPGTDNQLHLPLDHFSVFLIGTTAGSLLGLSVSGWSRNYAAIVQPYVICWPWEVDFRKLALAPLIILVFGIGLLSKGGGGDRAGRW